ncbi:MAG: hypothetical protein AVDCRST_MAG68-4801, partial [uncultured Gemmatimonadetes bacterium]
DPRAAPVGAGAAVHGRDLRGLRPAHRAPPGLPGIGQGVAPGGVRGAGRAAGVRRRADGHRPPPADGRRVAVRSLRRVPPVVRPRPRAGRAGLAGGHGGGDPGRARPPPISLTTRPGLRTAGRRSFAPM